MVLSGAEGHFGNADYTQQDNRTQRRSGKQKHTSDEWITSETQKSGGERQASQEVLEEA